jgi:hypothetical protein
VCVLLVWSRELVIDNARNGQYQILLGPQTFLIITELELKS